MKNIVLDRDPIDFDLFSTLTLGSDNRFTGGYGGDAPIFDVTGDWEIEWTDSQKTEGVLRLDGRLVSPYEDRSDGYTGIYESFNNKVPFKIVDGDFTSSVGRHHKSTHKYVFQFDPVTLSDCQSEYYVRKLSNKTK